ncbi:MAG: hypothetical protein EZS28_012940 [Streblomastix strix]|uniref:Uncharacterized protein n=1 Tax=Streblomastix strix TaxID=222440 RepID=A0A5J4W9I6_9EUKA|nr:MAG: hypothetical protein EZS28_012940 [Streblomastix strix]
MSSTELCVGSMSPLTQRKMLREQGVRIQDPPILQQDVGDQGSTDLAINIDKRAGCGDQGSTNLAINEDGLAECGDQRSTDFADQLESNQYLQKKQPEKGKQDESECIRQQNTSKIAAQYGTAYPRVSILSRNKLASRHLQNE